MFSVEYLQNAAQSSFFNRELRHVLEDHMLIIRGTATEMSITPNDSYRFHGNLYGLLASMNIMGDKGLFWLVMRCNNMYAPTDYNNGMLTLKMPNEETVTEILNTFRTKRRK